MRNVYIGYVEWEATTLFKCIQFKQLYSQKCPYIHSNIHGIIYLLHKDKTRYRGEKVLEQTQFTQVE